MENSKFQFKGFSVVRSLIERKQSNPKSKLIVEFKPKGTLNIENLSFKLELGIQISDEDKNINIEVDSIADYSFEKNVDFGSLDNFFYVNAPALLFPYLRAYISTLTNLSGNATITLPTLNLTSIGEELKKNTVTLK
ncbi:MAG: protein export chaperone secb [Chlorobi bacterium]|nr:protein export chaperone secb [Chlorobiota bacterium]